MLTEESTKTMTTTTSMSTIPGSTLAATEQEKQERLRDARNQLIVAAVVLAFITLVSVVLIVVKITSKPPEQDTPEGTDLTFKMPPSTILASPANEEPETTEEEPTSPPSTKKTLDAYPLLCTYGAETNRSTLFPDDGLCDLIFYDSAYKHDRSIPTLPASLSESMNAVLSASLSYKTTEIGIAFAFDHMATLRSDMKADKFLELFWDRHVYHFGIIDMPAFGVDYTDIPKVFIVLKELSALAQKNPNAVAPPYIVLGAVPLQRAHDYVSQMRGVYSPTLFISQGHFAYGDSEVPDCRVHPPTILTKPLASPGYPYDLKDAANALKQIQDGGVSAKWLLSVGMKGRWTKLRPSSQFHPSSLCEHDPQTEPFGNYAQVCADNYLNSNLKYSDALEAMYTFHAGSRNMFMYDDEQGICRKMCNIKSRQGALQFGLAAYDLEYEDYNNNCSARNRFGAFSRLKMVRKIVDYFRSSSGGGDCESDVPCA